MKQRVILGAAMLLLVQTLVGAVAFASPQTASTPRPVSATSIKACAAAICGTPTQNQSFITSLQQRAKPGPAFQTEWSQSVLPNLTKGILRDSTAETQRVARLAKLIQAGRLPKLGHPMQVIAVETMLDQAFLASALEEIFRPNKETQVPEIDREQLSKALADTPTLNQRAAAQILIEKVYLPLFQSAFYQKIVASGSDLDDRLTVLFPQQDKVAALLADAKRLVLQYQNLSQKFGGFATARMVDEEGVDLVKKAAQGRDLSSSESATYLKTALAIEKSQRLMDPQVYQALLAVKISPSVSMNEIKTQGLIAKKQADLLRNSAAKRTAAISSLCRARLFTALQSSATVDQVQPLQSQIPALKAAAKKLVSKYAGPSAAAKVDHAIDDAEFSFPPTPTETTTGLNQAFASLTAQADASAAESVAVSDDLDQTLLWSAPQILAPYDADSDAFAQACNLLPDDTLDDQAFTATGRISVGWLSIAYPDRGLTILAHELGHVVASALRKAGASGADAKGFLSSLNCIANRNPYVGQAVFLGYGDDTDQSNEDWADHFSNEMMASWSGVKPPNLGCTLVLMEQAAGEALSYEPEDEDPHSTPLFRALAAAIDRGQTLSPACRPFVAYASAKRPLTCE